jgi:hypothetical protein
MPRWCLLLHTTLHPFPGVTDEPAVQLVFAVKHHAVPTNRADVHQEGSIDSGLRRVPVSEHSINFQDLPVDDGGQDQPQTAGPTHLLLQVAPVGLALLVIVDLPSEGVQLLPFEEAAPQAPPERGIRQILEN